MRRYAAYMLCLVIYPCLSCSSVNDFLESAVQKPIVKFSELKIESLSFEEIDLNVELELQNPNKIGVDLSGYDYQLLLNENSFVKGMQNTSVSIPASGSTQIPLPLTLNYKDIYSTYKTLKDNDSTSYEIKCGLSFDLPVLGDQYIPVSKTGKLPLLKPPAVNISSLHLQSLNITGAELELVLSINNTNNMSFFLTGMNYNLQVNGLQWISAESDTRQAVAAKSANKLAFPFRLNFLQMGQSARQLLVGDENLGYELTGNFELESNNALLGRVNLPLNRSGELKINR
jgi:LEA14-like dessication related protein